MLDVPVFWPILLCYWIVLFILTMKRQIMHMIKYKYVPFSTGKQVRALEFFYLSSVFISIQLECINSQFLAIIHFLKFHMLNVLILVSLILDRGTQERSLVFQGIETSKNFPLGFGRRSCSLDYVLLVY